MLSLGSPFPPEHLRLLLADHIETTYKKRGESYDDIAESIAALVSQRAGNYLAFFPSYKYMEEVATRFAEAHPDIDLLVQESGMSDRQREAFLSAFDAEPLQAEQYTVGFAVMGGVFGEGIDLVGERLSRGGSRRRWPAATVPRARLDPPLFRRARDFPALRTLMFIRA